MAEWKDPEDEMLDDAADMMDNKGYWCEECVHLHEDGITCDAFPDQIPFPLWRGMERHTTPFEGDNGIMFEPRK